MKILITGAAGMLGRKLAESLLASGSIGGHAIEELRLVDVIEPQVSSGTIAGTHTMAVDLTAQGVASELISHRPDIVFHLAAVVSGEAEADFDKGYRINLDATQDLLNAIRVAHDQDTYTPRLVFASSIAVFGAPFPDHIGDEFFHTPLTSYGTQKAIAELLLSDYTRRGILDGIGLRLPTICIRPGKPNKAASGFFSNILREPLNGVEAVLPVSDSVRHWFASPRAGVNFLLHAATLDGSLMGNRRNITLPGLSATVAEQLISLERMAGSAALKLIKRKPDAQIQSIVAGWPQNFHTPRALELGFVAESSFDEIVQVYMDDEMG